jgi:pimeloyl-ACP methyl ester carboxylesterase
MQQHYLQYHWFGRHYSLGYRAHGDVTSPNVLLCVHGVSRNAKDFDVIAEALADHYHVIALDMPGRGQSEWLEEKGHYGQQLYEIVTGQIMGMTGAKQLDWLGTSMGGMLGMRVASREQSPIRRMVLNDIGPFVPAEGRAQNARVFGLDTRFASEAEGVAWIRENRTAFGPFTDAGWERFGRDSLRQISVDQWGLDYDPGLSQTSNTGDFQAWDQWEAITCPVLCVWGTDSTLLTADTVARMKVTGPKAQVFEVPGVGHCPGLTDAAQIGAVRDFLTA